MAVNQKVKIARPSGDQFAPEVQHLPDVLWRRRLLIRWILNHVVKAQLQPLMLGKRAEFMRYGRVRTQDRQHMGYPGSAKSGQLGKAADRDPERKYRRHLSRGT